MDYLDYNVLCIYTSSASFVQQLTESSSDDNSFTAYSPFEDLHQRIRHHINFRHRKHTKTINIQSFLYHRSISTRLTANNPISPNLHQHYIYSHLQYYHHIRRNNIHRDKRDRDPYSLHIQSL